MRRRRSKISNPGVSLFPFLAVLICTLGVLIVLLVIAVQSASVEKNNQQHAAAAKHQKQMRQQQAKKAELAAERKKRIAEQKAEQQAALAKLEDELELRELQAEGFEADRPRIRRELTKARDYRAHLEKEIQSLEEQASQLVSQIKLLNSDLVSIDTEIDDTELDQLRQKVALAEQTLVTKRSNTVLITNRKYAIVPYRGNGGTSRIPVFVECGSDGVVLQPWNIKLTTDDFFQPVTAGNPVDAALVAVRNYYQKHDLVDKDQRPYPLLVVRPDGAQSYGLARRSLISWDDEFGYELVTAEKELDFGSADPQLADEVRVAVEKSRQIQLALKRRRANAIAMSEGGGVGFGTGGDPDSGFGQQSKGSESRSGSEQTNELASGSGEFRQASFEGKGSEKKSGKIATSFEDGAVSTADGNFAGSSTAKSAGPNSIGSNDSTESLAQQRGANWALPTETRGATGYVRPVSMVVGAKSLSIKNVAGEVVSFPVDGDGAEAIDRMVNILWQRIDSWGIAGANAYWKPNLVVTVQTGADKQFATLKRMLSNSGLGIQEVGK